jgi:hypothetical protein
VKFGNVTVGEGGNWIHYVEEGDDNPLLGFANEINFRRYYNKIFLAFLSKLLCFSFIRYIFATVETIIYETRVLAGIAIFLQFFFVHNQH